MTYKNSISRLGMLFFSFAVFLLATNSSLGQTAGRKEDGDRNNGFRTDKTLVGNGTRSLPLGIADGGVTANKMADGSVTANKMADGSVTASKIADGSVSTATLVDRSVSTSKIADGSVTADKLATDNTPEAGQVLTFNGTGLSWQTPAAGGGNAVGGPLRYVDSNNAEVGLVFGQGEATRYMPEGYWVSFLVLPSGVYDRAIQVYYESSDCSGTATYMAGSDFSSSFTRTAQAYAGNLYIPSATGQYRMVGSVMDRSNGSDGCYPMGFHMYVSTYTTIPLSKLGLTAPFRLAR